MMLDSDSDPESNVADDVNDIGSVLNDTSTDIDDMLMKLTLEARELLAMSEVVIEMKTQVRTDLQRCIDGWSWSRHDAMLHVLESPQMVHPVDIEALNQDLQDLTEHSYSKRMRSVTYKKVGRNTGKVEAAKLRWQETDRLRVTSSISSLARQKDRRCVPPLTLMRSIDSMYTNTSSTIWRRESQEQHLLSKTSTEKYIEDVKGWRCKPVFDSIEDITSVRYSLSVYDNLEFTLPVETERFIDGALKKSTLLHTVTSESSHCNPNPNPTLTLP